ncbi:unnamed protein product [Rhizoctonia solani]|uniref:FMR1-interacting protein 1 conserved domain-containing protein n=1 Tax=Rhizoctonia solani TaxID=456999 RepID=A0A8H3BXY2_9AGAM|nr:unnamed protein product [Rhizoctonia solani]
MSWNTGFGPSYTNGQMGNYYHNQMQPHYANAYHYQQQGAAMSQPTQITLPSPGVSSYQPMSSLVPLHMRNRSGPVKCGHEGCLFAGTHEEVEVHKMDRHLIFPPGWQGKGKGKGKRKRDYDDSEYVDEEAQFRTSSAVSILGTDIKLDSPEAMAAWLQERKKRWPSARRIAEKVQHRREALERGQILAEPSRPHRSGADNSHGRVMQSQRGRGRGRGKPVNQIQTKASEAKREAQLPLNVRGRISHARGRGGRGSRFVGGRGQDKPLGTEFLPVNPKRSKETNPTSNTDSSTSTESSPGSDSETTSDDDSGSDMDPLKDAVSSKTEPPRDANTEIRPPGNEVALVQRNEEVSSANARSKTHMPRRGAPQPPKPAYNPFNQRPSLLRNLLMPDIQATVSNLSQAIKFLVANDFLENVELKPGDAENVPIQPMDVDTPAATI